MYSSSATSTIQPVNPPAARANLVCTVLIVDDHPVFRKGIATLLSEMTDVSICGEAEDARKGLDAFRRHRPDVVLLDISMPGINGLELTKMLLFEDPALKIIILSMHDESLYALRTLRAGAKGYVMKAEAMTDVRAALRKVMGGGIYLSPRFSERLVFKMVQASEMGGGSAVDNLSDRELEVLQHLGKGLGTSEIASQLHLSVKTIETHRMHIKEKLNLKDGREVARFAVEWVQHLEN